MKIEVACKREASNKDKGDLLEKLSKRLLEARGYHVIEEIRIAGAELDLLCEHKVNSRKIYVECKAHKSAISAPTLRQLWGTVDSEEYSEGWLISISDFTKDAKGFIEKWKGKEIKKSSRLSFYSPKLVVDALLESSVIRERPIINAEDCAGGKEFIGDWTLLVTELGMFWCVYTLKGGTPYGVLVHYAETGKLIQDKEMLDRLSDLDSDISAFDFNVALNINSSNELPTTSALPLVVEVQTGESWNDYRPARPQDFVGRDTTQKEILNFLNSAKNNVGTRIFAITGNSGLGKSSLVAKLRDRSKNVHYRKKYFVYAVDIRGATTATYILSSFIQCLTQAQAAGFGEKTSLKLTDPTTPLASPDIRTYLNSLSAKGQVVCLIFDQFEELYSKPELFGIFKAAKDLMLNVAASKKNFVLGFAWKTDSTTQQDHPAYHMWHELSDHRKEYRLDVFDNGEVSKSITSFEKEIGFKVSAETRHQINNSCQGFPWLLKKLCINLFEGLSKGEDSESALLDFDVARLFESDLESLTPQENSCVRLVAQKAPADWSEIIEISGVSTLNSLVNKRLVIKSGDRLNVYWDIFKDYLLTGRVPVIPFNYIPSSDLSSMLKICSLLVSDKFLTSSDLASKSSLNEKTVWNIGADLVMFGLAERESTSFKLHRSMTTYSDDLALKLLRTKLDKHSLKILLYKKHAGKTIEKRRVIAALKESLPKASFGEKTWKIYTNRLIKFLLQAGFLSKAGQKIVIQDSGVSISDARLSAGIGNRRGIVFSVSVSPLTAFETLERIIEGENQVNNFTRNSLALLKRFELVTIDEQSVILNRESISKFGGPLEAIWSIAKNESSLMMCIEIINVNSEISAVGLAQLIANEFALNWSDASLVRTGRVLMQWSTWIKEGIDNSKIPTLPGCQNKSDESQQPALELD
jgi:hypothetical protein